MSDPNDPRTWIKKLDDPREQKDAVRMLKKLHEQNPKDNQALVPLMELYKKTKDPEHLRAVAVFSDPQSVPVLVEALDYSDESFDTASIAATALGEIGDKGAVDALVKAVQKPLPIKTRANVVKLESMKALAKIKDPRAVDALIKVLQTPADEQDFFLNKVAAKSLGEFADPKAVPALVRGLFMTGRGANIFQECRTALLTIGEPAIEPLVQAMQHKNPDIEADAKKYQFVPGIVEQKTAMLLGDLRNKKAIPALLEGLKAKDEGIAAGEDKGVSGHREMLSALGRIGDAAQRATLESYAKDVKRPKAERLGAFDGLWELGDAAAAPVLFAAANTRFLGTNDEVTGGALAMFAVTGYSRLAAPGASSELQKVPDDIVDAFEAFETAKARVAVGNECKQDPSCYEKYLDKSGNSTESAKAEKAAYMLMELGKDKGLPVLLKHLGATDPAARLMILFGVARLGDKSCADCQKALDKQIATDEGKPPLLPLVHEMRAVRAIISH